MERVLFREEQRFGQWWIWLITIVSFAAVIISFSIGLYTQLVLGKPWGDNPTSDLGLVLIAAFSFLVVLAIVFLLLKMKLITEVRTDGIWFRFPPLMLKWKCIRKEEIESYEIRRYRPIAEYGGFGIRQGLGKWGKAYNVSGKTGLQLYLFNKKKLLIGTQKRQALKYAMDKMTGQKEANG